MMRCHARVWCSSPLLSSPRQACSNILRQATSTGGLQPHVDRWPIARGSKPATVTKTFRLHSRRGTRLQLQAVPQSRTKDYQVERPTLGLPLTVAFLFHPSAKKGCSCTRWVKTSRAPSRCPASIRLVPPRSMSLTKGSGWLCQMSMIAVSAALARSACLRYT